MERTTGSVGARASKTSRHARKHSWTFQSCLLRLQVLVVAVALEDVTQEVEAGAEEDAKGLELVQFEHY